MEGDWRHFYTGNAVDTSLGAVFGVTEDTSQNCGILVYDFNGWTPWQCQINRAHVITCACEHPGQMYLQLRGLCPDSNIDRFYVPRNKHRSAGVHLIGLDTSTIDYDHEKVSWILREGIKTAYI